VLLLRFLLLVLAVVAVAVWRSLPTPPGCWSSRSSCSSR
jgi:hypothetical protein